MQCVTTSWHVVDYLGPGCTPLGRLICSRWARQGLFRETIDTGTELHVVQFCGCNRGQRQ